MTSEMAFECLLITRDAELHGTISNVLRSFSINVDHCVSSSKGQDLISNGTHDLVVIDWQGDASSELLQTIWRLPKKKKPTVLAISNEWLSVPGAHVSLRKPITFDSGIQSLKLAYSRMLLDYRLNARFAVMIPTHARDDHGRNHPITVIDVGDGGIGVKSAEQLGIGEVLSLGLVLPGSSSSLHIKARVVWTRDYGVAGCEIVSIPPVDRDILRDWLKSKTRVKKPLIPV